MKKNNLFCIALVCILCASSPALAIKLIEVPGRHGGFSFIYKPLDGFEVSSCKISYGGQVIQNITAQETKDYLSFDVPGPFNETGSIYLNCTNINSKDSSYLVYDYREINSGVHYSINNGLLAGALLFVVCLSFLLYR